MSSYTIFIHNEQKTLVNFVSQTAEKYINATSCEQKIPPRVLIAKTNYSSNTPFIAKEFCVMKTL